MKPRRKRVDGRDEPRPDAAHSVVVRGQGDDEFEMTFSSRPEALAFFDASLGGHGVQSVHVLELPDNTLAVRWQRLGGLTYGPSYPS